VLAAPGHAHGELRDVRLVQSAQVALSKYPFFPSEPPASPWWKYKKVVTLGAVSKVTVELL
jgi:hypothetical protein